ncbi:competence protein TfoX [Candidatus Aerophobetes bacterium]|uniref:Competence protein TfoX n=1 Tax=Aerophobetes bacterium TaxID=2030807 RepID=A0A2A4X3K1_UNCAE|nr:MAG: competence protein TfoX [Candidatus Aerophobetes bacterium]
MASRKEFALKVVEQINEDNSVTSRAMFGGFAIYCDLKVVGLICEDSFYIKPTEKGDTFLGSDLVEEQPYPTLKPWFLISASLLSDRTRMSALARITADQLPPPKPKRKKTARSHK